MYTRPRRRLLHTSDVHLGTNDARGLPPRSDAHSEAFHRVIDLALCEDVDALLVAGDFFDNAAVKMATLEFAADEIRRLGRTVVIAPGNHDHVGPNSVYDRYDFATAAPNLRLMRGRGGETVCLPDLDIEVWGRPHVEHSPLFSPFADAPPRGEAAWQIGIGHGHFIHPRAARERSYHILAEHLEATKRDYIALGHWDQLTRVSAGERTVAAYSGAPGGVNGGDLPGYALIVDLCEDGEVRLTAHALFEDSRVEHDDIPLLFGV